MELNKFYLRFSNIHKMNKIFFSIFLEIDHAITEKCRPGNLIIILFRMNSIYLLLLQLQSYSVT